MAWRATSAVDAQFVAGPLHRTHCACSPAPCSIGARVDVAGVIEDFFHHHHLFSRLFPWVMRRLYGYLDIKKRDMAMIPRSSITFTRKKSSGRGSFLLFACFVISSLPFLVVGLMSHFKPGVVSTPLQRGSILAWFSCGLVIGVILSFISHKNRINGYHVGAQFSMLSAWSLLFAPAIGDMVMVGDMIWAYGNCIRVV